MHILISPTAFKGCLSAFEVSQSIQQGINIYSNDIHTTILPVADGGDDTAEILVKNTHGTFVQTIVTGPLGNQIPSSFGILGDNTTAIVELAKASGLALVDPKRRDAMHATTYGTGELIKQALDHGCTTILIGLGGSATTDGGAGIISALGAKLFNSLGTPIGYGGVSLSHVSTIDLSTLDPRLKKTTIVVACDVKNPLTGPTGAAHVYGPQKGATQDMINTLDANLTQYADILEHHTQKTIRNLPGVGAAGGSALSLLSCCNATLSSGIDLVLDTLHFDQLLQTADLVITGEGRMDSQTINGKAPAGIAHRAQTYNIPLAAIVGELQGDALKFPIPTIIPLMDGRITRQYAIKHASQLITQATLQLLNTLHFKAKP